MNIKLIKYNYKIFTQTNKKKKKNTYIINYILYILFDNEDECKNPE